MSYEVSIVADSISPAGARITTFQLKYPRMVHAELMTHRMFSRNASSSRAIPTAKMIEWIEQDPAMPVYWGKNQKGMQATAELTEDEVLKAKGCWLSARDAAVVYARYLMDCGVHKQIASRILEPWAHINVVLTGTTFDNFFALRCHKAAMPEIQSLAVNMARAYRDNVPVPLRRGYWHLPYVSPEEIEPLVALRLAGKRPNHTIEDEVAVADYVLRLLKLSTARCARVSYRTFDGATPDTAKDIELHDTLEHNGHWSPFEHAARSTPEATAYSGNFWGWKQYRQILRKSVHQEFDFAALDQFEGRNFIV